MVAAYKVPLIEELIARLLVKTDTAILTNLVLGENVVPEFLQRDCTPVALAAALLPLIADTPERRRQIEALARLDAIMGIGEEAPSERAAAAVLTILAALNQPAREAMARGRVTA